MDRSAECEVCKEEERSGFFISPIREKLTDEEVDAIWKGAKN